ncbi:MAG: M1 family metallopeptidase [Planctomycetes bacterium]|nr:M1 family metallopeptidase [Planctomycetota bacterium]
MHASASLRRPAQGTICILGLAALLAFFPPLARAEDGDSKHLTRDYDLEELTLDLTVDMAAHKVAGTATYLFHPLTDDFASLVFHSEDTVVLAVHVGERGKTKPARRVRLQDGLLTIELARPAAKGTALEVKIEYEAHPTTGLFFYAPGPDSPEVPAQAWTQGEDRDNHHWFPCYDEPDERFKLTQRLHVPEGYQVVANGVLQETRSDEVPGPPARRETTFVYRFDHNLVAYLVSFVVGRFDVAEETWEGIPVRGYVPPGLRSAARLAFGRTPEMLSFFSEYTGRRYPYPSYSQTCIWDFPWEGMENSSVTSLELGTLHSPRGHLDYRSDSLVSHELAHQWFGDLVTCKDWSEMWLNEGFATYFADLWLEHREGPDEFAIERVETADSYVSASTAEALAALKPGEEKDEEDGEEPAEAKGENGKGHPKKPLELKGDLNYTKGSVVLHLLRHVLGEERFRQGIQAYVARFADTCVTSEDFRKVMEGTSGEDLSWLFDQWVYGAGVPDFSVEYEWHADRKSVVLRVRQTQPESLGRGVFRVPVELGFGLVESSGATRVERKRVTVDARQQEFEAVLPREPDFVRFDVGCRVAKRLDFPRAPSMLEAQLLHDPDVTGRYEAAELLAEEGEAGRRALAKGLASEPFWRVRRRIAESLPVADAAGAQSALLEAAGDARAEVRAAAAEGLGKLRGDWVDSCLLDLAERDPSDRARAAALRSLAAVRTKGAAAVLRRALRRPSHRERVRAAAIEGLVALGDPAAVPDLLRLATRERIGGAIPDLAPSALEEAATLAPKDPRVAEAALKALGDVNPHLRAAAASALARVRSAKGSAALLDRAKSETDPSVKAAIDGALRKLLGAEAEVTPAAGADDASKGTDELEAAAQALEQEAAELALDSDLKKLDAQRLRLRAKVQRGKQQGDTKK